MSFHLHPEIRKRGKIQFLQLLTDAPTNFVYKRVLDVLLRRLFKAEAFVGAHRDIIAFINKNCSSYMHLVSDRFIFRLIDSGSDEICDFGLWLVRHNFTPENISLSRIVQMANHKYVAVRSYAWELMEPSAST